MFEKTKEKIRHQDFSSNNTAESFPINDTVMDFFFYAL